METKTKVKLAIFTGVTVIAVIKMFFWGIVTLGVSAAYFVIKRKFRK